MKNIRKLLFYPDGKLFGYTRNDGIVVVWNTTTKGKELKRLFS